MKMKLKLNIGIIQTFIILAVIIVGSFNIILNGFTFKTRKANNVTITQREAINNIKLVDKKVKKLTTCNKMNTVRNIVDRYSKNYFMFLINYGSGEGEYTSETMYLVNKKTGRVYSLLVGGTPVLLKNPGNH